MFVFVFGLFGKFCSVRVRFAVRVLVRVRLFSAGVFVFVFVFGLFGKFCSVRVRVRLNAVRVQVAVRPERSFVFGERFVFAGSKLSTGVRCSVNGVRSHS